jgi:hypothetical protein
MIARKLMCLALAVIFVFAAVPVTVAGDTPPPGTDDHNIHRRARIRRSSGGCHSSVGLLLVRFHRSDVLGYVQSKRTHERTEDGSHRAVREKRENVIGVQGPRSSLDRADPA